jgi:hypothetical protein
VCGVAIYGKHDCFVSASLEDIVLGNSYTYCERTCFLSASTCAQLVQDTTKGKSSYNLLKIYFVTQLLNGIVLP